MQDTTVKVAMNDMLNIGPEEAILSLKALFIGLFLSKFTLLNAALRPSCGGFNRVNLQRIDNMLNFENCEAGK